MSRYSQPGAVELTIGQYLVLRSSFNTFSNYQQQASVLTHFGHFGQSPVQ